MKRGLKSWPCLSPKKGVMEQDLHFPAYHAGLEGVKGGPGHEITRSIRRAHRSLHAIRRHERVPPVAGSDPEPVLCAELPPIMLGGMSKIRCCG